MYLPKQKIFTLIKKHLNPEFKVDKTSLTSAVTKGSVIFIHWGRMFFLNIYFKLVILSVAELGLASVNTVLFYFKSPLLKFL